MHCEQGVVLTRRNSTGPPSRAAPCDLRCICAPVECYRRRRQTPTSKTILAPYTMCRRASNTCKFWNQMVLKSGVRLSSRKQPLVLSLVLLVVTESWNMPTLEPSYHDVHDCYLRPAENQQNSSLMVAHPNPVQKYQHTWTIHLVSVC